MKLQERKVLLERLGTYLTGNDPLWLETKEKAFRENPWFLPEFIDSAVTAISRQYLDAAALNELSVRYQIPEENPAPKKVGIVMAGNLPLVGFHDFLCVFISGHRAIIKPSSKDEVLIKHIISKLAEWQPDAASFLVISEMLKNCDAYIATGSNNSARYFEYYFSKWPSIIRRNRTSVAVLTGKESTEDLEKLADDVYMYFGLGCRNVSKILVPEGYDFIPLLEAFRKYDHLSLQHKYKNNYDYNLAILILNNKYYMTNGSILLVENDSLFSPISQLHYSFYSDEASLQAALSKQESLQCIVAAGRTPFGSAQQPGLCDYADGVDTMQFLLNL